MKNIILVQLIILFLASSFCKAQIDAVKIGSGKKAYENGEYQNSIEQLNLVSTKYRNNKVFLYYYSNSHYMLQNYDSAEVYFKKYLLVDKKNEYFIAEVLDKLSTIDYERNKKKLEEEKRIESLRIAELKIKEQQEAAIKKEKDKFFSCKASNDINCFKLYLKLYPNGIYSLESKNAISSIEEQKYKETLRNGTIGSFTSFLSLYPNSKYENQARQNLNDLKEKKRQKENILSEANKFNSLYLDNENQIRYSKNSRKVFTVFGLVFAGLTTFWYLDPIDLLEDQIFRIMAAAPLGGASLAFLSASLSKTIKISKQKKQKKINFEKYQELKSKAEIIQVY